MQEFINPDLGRRTSAAWVAGGTLWLGGAIVDHDSGWRFFTAETLWVAADLVLLIGLLGLWRLRPHGNSRTAGVAFGVAAVARLTFVSAELTLLVAADNNNAVGTALLPVAAALTAVSMLVVGVSVARRGVWHGASRFGPLTMGVYPFVGMFPVVVATGAPNLVSIGCWGLAAIVVGLAVRSATAPPFVAGSQVAVAS
jgi:hypothetical protein